MDLKDIAAVSGKGGLFKVLKPTRTGVILETIDENKTKLIANANSRVSLLKEISVYTTSKDASLPLENVFKSIYEKFGKDLKVSAKSHEEDLKSFLKSVVPDYDTEKVYNSDIKKIVTWYSLLAEYFPEIFQIGESSSKEGKEPAKKEGKKVAKEEKTETKAAGEKSEKKPSKKEEAASDKTKDTSKKK